MTWFLLISLLFPRLCLLVAYLNHQIPQNDVPLFFDFFGAAFFPRMLILYYIWFAELGTGWFIVHLIALIISMIIKSAED
mgnify:CR=1 FL=1